METHFPFKIILVSVSLQSILFGMQSNIFHDSTSSDIEQKEKSSFIIDVLSFIIITIAIIYTEKFKSEGRKGYFFKNSLALVRVKQAGCFLISSIFIVNDGFLAAVVGFVILIVQNVCKLNILTTILSIIYIQNLEVGFYFGLQFLVFEVSLVFGSLFNYAFDSNVNLFIFYLFIIVLFVFTSHTVQQRLSKEHEEVDTYDWRLWGEIYKVRFFRMNFYSFSITLGVASYIYLITFEAFDLLNIITDGFIVLSMLITFPLCLYFVYKHLRPVQNKAFIVFGLVFQSLSLLFLMLVYSNKGKNTQIIAIISPVISQVGLVFVTVSALPDMIKSTVEELTHVEKGVLTDRVCSLSYAALYFGKIIIKSFTSIFRELMNFEVGMVLGSLAILMYAALYEHFGHGVRNFKRGKVESEIEQIDLKGDIDMSEYLIVK